VKIVKLTRSEKKPDIFYAEFEDGSSLRVNIALIADYSLYTGRELDEDEFDSLKSSAGAATAKARALRILGKRNMSRREITDRLQQKGESEETAEETADWLTKIGAVNDAEYASLIVRHYISRGYGKMRVQDELYRRGIDKELWEEALTGLPETEDKAYDYLSSKLRGSAPDKAALKRVTDALYRRGFSWDEIKSAILRYNEALDSNQRTYGETEDLTNNE
jgi:regulatory protein